MKVWLLRGIDVLAIAIIAALALAFCAGVCFGLWLMAQSIFDYLTSREGRGLAYGIGMALAVWASAAWLRRRYDRPDRPCVVCGKPAVGMRTSDRALLCAYHTGQRP